MEGNEKTKVFISWSGELSHEVAKILRKKLPAIIQSVEVFFSSTDIQKGENGVQAISKSLQDSQISIVILTKGNKDKPWILFEAGCIHGHGGIFCSLLIDVSTEEITGPLLQFQHTLFNEEDFYSLLKTINAMGTHPLDQLTLRESFNGHWNDILNMVNKAVKRFPEQHNTRQVKIQNTQLAAKIVEVKYTVQEQNLAKDVIRFLCYCGLLGNDVAVYQVAEAADWDENYTRYILDMCRPNGWIELSESYRGYTLTNTAHYILNQLGLFNQKGYADRVAMDRVIGQFNANSLVWLCKCLFGQK